MKTETFVLKEDMVIFYVTATSFPNDISGAHEKLHALLANTNTRSFYGVSRPNKKGVIIYHAGVEEIEKGEGEKYNCESMILKKGNYTSILIEDYTKNLLSISKAFEKLLHDPHIDPEGYCVEMYLDADAIRCMVRLK